MQKVFSQAFDAVKIGEECKQKLKDTLIEFQSDSAVDKKVKEKRKFQWTMRRVIIAASTAAVMIFCAIFIPLMAFNGDGNGTDMTATYKVQLLAAVNQLKNTDSYEESIEVTTNIDGQEALIKYRIKYKKQNDAYIAQGIMESERTSQVFYFADGFMYMPATPIELPQSDERPPAWTQINGIKIHLEEEIISLCQFFAKNSGFITPETINSLSKESSVNKIESGDDFIYSFKASIDGISDEYPTTAEYVITVESSSGRILKIQQSNTTKYDGQEITGNLNANYVYGNIEVNLPDDLETYVEYTG